MPIAKKPKTTSNKTHNKSANHKLVDRKSPLDALSNAGAAAAFLAAIGREVRRSRAKRGMTRRQLAEASRASERYLAQIESGAGNPSVTVLRAIAQALDLPAAALLGEPSAHSAARAALLDLVATLPDLALAELTDLIEARLVPAESPIERGGSPWLGCAAPVSPRLDACWRVISAGLSSSSTAWSNRITAPASRT